jgi:ketosteroid isomerase-like protein
MSAENVALLERIYERWGRGDFDVELSSRAEMTFALGPEFPDSGEHVGPEGVAAYMRSFLEPWDELTMKAEEMIETGEDVLVRLLQSGIGKSSGVAVELRYFHLWRFEGSRLVRMEAIMEESDAMARAGED